MADGSGGHISYQPAPRHPCTPPDPARYPLGTRWTCDTCHDFWEVRAVVPLRPGVPHHFWKRGLPYPGHVVDRPPFPVIPVLVCLLVALAAGIALILTI